MPQRGELRRSSSAARRRVLALPASWSPLRAADRRRPRRRAPRFVDDTRRPGSTTVHGDFEYFVGGGVAAFDCDDDGRPELYLAGGSDRPRSTATRARSAARCDSAQLPSPVTDLTAVTGAYPLDIDSDGTIDLVVLRRGGDVVLRGLGDCRFEPANEHWASTAATHWTAAFSATWEGTNALPTLAFGELPRAGHDECDDSQLVRPAAAGDVYAAPDPLTPGYCTLSVLFSDWSRSGRRDLRVTNDRHYYLDGEDSCGGSSPASRPALYTEADGWRPLQIWGMGIASQDLTGDGYPEVFLTSQGDNKLQTLADGPAQPAYEDIALARGVTAQRPVRRRRRAPVDRVAPRVRGRQQRRLRRPVRRPRATSRPRSTTPAATRATSSSAAPTARSWRRRRRPASSASNGPAAPLSSTSTWTGCSTSWW